MEGIPEPRSAAEAEMGLTYVQDAIENINSRILLLQMQRERYEQIGHTMVELMMRGER